MQTFRTADLVYPNLAPPKSLTDKLDWRHPNKSQPGVNTLQEHQFVEIQNHGGGNCFFACIAEAVYGHESFHMQVRSEVMKFYVRTMMTGYKNLSTQQQIMMVYGFGHFSSRVLQPDEFANFVLDWVNKVRESGECCSEIDMMVPAFIYQIQIIVLKYSHRQKYVYDDKGVRRMNSHNQIQTKCEGAMGSYIIEGSSTPFVRLLGLENPHFELDAISNMCADVKLIMIYNQYIPGRIKDVLSRGPKSKYDEGGHYTLLNSFAGWTSALATGC